MMNGFSLGVLSTNKGNGRINQGASVPHSLVGQESLAPGDECVWRHPVKEDFMLSRENSSSHWLLEQPNSYYRPRDLNCGKEELGRSYVYVGLLGTRLQDFVGVAASVRSTSSCNKDPLISTIEENESVFLIHIPVQCGSAGVGMGTLSHKSFLDQALSISDAVTPRTLALSIRLEGERNERGWGEIF